MGDTWTVDDSFIWKYLHWTNKDCLYKQLAFILPMYLPSKNYNSMHFTWIIESRFGDDTDSDGENYENMSDLAYEDE